MADLPIPPWLNPPNYGELFLGGMRTGAAASEAAQRTALEAEQSRARIGLAAQQAQTEAMFNQQKLQQAREQAELSARVKMDIADRAARERQAKIAIDTAYKTSLLGLNQSKMEQAKIANDFKIKQAADKSAAMMEYENVIGQIDRSDLNEDQKREAKNRAIMTLGPRMSGGSMAGIAPMLKQMAPPPNLTAKPIPIEGGGTLDNIYDVGGKPFRSGVGTEDKSMQEYRKVRAGILADSIKSLKSDLIKTTDEEVKKKLKEQIASEEKEMQSLFIKGDQQQQEGMIYARDPITGKISLKVAPAANIGEAMGQWQAPPPQQQFDFSTPFSPVPIPEDQRDESVPDTSSPLRIPIFHP